MRHPADRISGNNLRHLPLILLTGWALLVIGFILRSMSLCDGLLVYTLDDPYIHLAVADRINAGGYGVNLGEYSSPSSSILYPVILAGTEIAGLGMSGPLVVNLVAMGGVVYLIGIFLRKWDGLGLFAAFVFGMLLCANINAWGLVMTGMEHSLHLLVVAVVVIGLFDMAADSELKPSWWFIACIVAMPLIRFEGAALSAAALGALWLSNHRRTAISAAALLLASVVAWVFFTATHGLPVMPSSVQMKSSSVSGVLGHAGLYSTLHSIGENALQNVRNKQGTYMLLLQLAIAWMLWLAPQASRREKLAGGVVLGAGVAHLLFGRYGWFSRYEIYLFLATIIAAIALVRPYLGIRAVRIAIFVFPFFAAAAYVRTARLSPDASKNIYEQQYQMRRFAQELWKKPVAVNDLGLVSYRNSAYVLDLAGLGSEKIRKLRQANRLNAAEIQEAVADRKVGLVMIYENWFQGAIPPNWIKVATLNTSRVAAAEPKVAFFATSHAYAEEIKRLLPAFVAGLPSGASLDY